MGNDPADEMVKVGPLCVDKYEASVWSSPTGGTQFGATADDYPCSDNGNACTGTTAIYARSEFMVPPSRLITWFQAQQACANSGKRLLTNAEWQMAAAGTPDGPPCIVLLAPGPGLTGTAGCVSNWGTFDMVGNLFEWVGDWIQGNTNPWAPSGSVPNPIITTNANFGDDIMLGINPSTSQGSGQAFPAALSRGGGFGSDTTAGVFALFAIAPSQAGGTLGFRCGR